MRIAYLINQYPKVSHSFIRREILALERQGHLVHRLAIRGWDLELVDPADLTERTKTKYVLRKGVLSLFFAVFRTAVLKPRRFIRAFMLSLQMSTLSDRSRLLHFVYLAEACKIVPWLIEQRIQHLHAHFGTNSADVAMLTNVLGGPSWSFTVHGPEEFDRKLVIGLAEKVRRSAFAVGISSFGRAQLYRLVDHRYWPKLHIVHCGIDAAFEADPENNGTIGRRLICVGRLCEQKGQLLLLEATRRLIAAGIDFELVLAGDGDMRGDLEGFISRHSLERHVRITGWISATQVHEEISTSRALVLPSFAEGLPVVIMEAMACERPVISTYIAGIPELVRTGQDGWLIAAGDVDALVEAMRECLAASDATIATMGSSARVRVLQRHTIDREASKLAALFEATTKETFRDDPDCANA